MVPAFDFFDDGIEDIVLVEATFDQELDELDRVYARERVEFLSEAADEAVVGLVVPPLALYEGFQESQEF